MTSDHDLKLDAEAATAHMEHHIEKEEPEWSVVFDELTAGEVLTLQTALSQGMRYFADKDSKGQFKICNEMGEQVHEQNEELFAPIRGVMDEAAIRTKKGDEDMFPQSRLDFLKVFFSRPMKAFPAHLNWNIADRAWALGLALVFTQAGVAIINIFQLLGGMGGLPYNDAILAGITVTAVALLTFALGHTAGDRSSSENG